ncbi:MAG: cob(I)yrinic acid a,c-diamide adenosyltransferase [Synergistales bacterium]|nr:cob(I)yrinic acid a,c-diamide adenosyltransferase [Synergistales bacterium]
MHLHEQGIVHVYTGNGKGKTTAALGMVLRTAGHGGSSAVIQFCKGWEHYGEIKTVSSLPQVTFLQTGTPDFVDPRQPYPIDFEEAQRGLQSARSILNDGEIDLLVLDEINIAIAFGLLAWNDVKQLLQNRPPYIEVVMTGRNAPEAVISFADLVTEFREIRHPFQQGFQPQRGREY